MIRKSRLIGKMHHPRTRRPRKIREGFSWPCLFFNFLWYLYKGMFSWVFLSIALTVITAGIGWLILPFYANRQHIQSLINKGFLPDYPTWQYLIEKEIITGHYPAYKERTERNRIHPLDVEVPAERPRQRPRKTLQPQPAQWKTNPYKKTL